MPFIKINIRTYDEIRNESKSRMIFKWMCILIGTLCIVKPKKFKDSTVSPFINQ